ncbi:MAG: tetratricopeptide repeat protein [Verrucomicrobiota bacterium]|nr:outer membrane protein assembly factor BamD [Limisphaera sp.]MDW8382148.1 tetratricopeptide repeat protein [Verrucomicrobiota bacterium]
MNRWWQSAVSLVSLLLGGAFITWMLWQWMRRSRDEPLRLVAKWIVTALCVLAMVWTYTFFILAVPIVAAVCGMILSILWTPNIVETLLRPLWHAWTGEDESPEPKPFYSIARAKRQRGQYAAALADVRAQLNRFPDDVEGHMLAAEILAENMGDLEQAEDTIQQLCQLPGHSPQNAAYALATLADWYLRIRRDPENARRILEQLVEQYPETDLAVTARQRLARMPSAEQLLQTHESAPIRLRKGIENIGLQRAPVSLVPPEEPPEVLAARYVEHLQRFPDDFETREKLAVLYADAFQRLDLAQHQLEQLIHHAGASPAQVAHWLNLLADLQIRHGCDEPTVRATLEKIEALLPDSPQAEQARRRLNLLGLEFKRRKKPAVVQLGVYEQNLGLKGRLPR